MNEEKKTDLPEQEAKTAAEETACEEKETKAAEAEAATEKAEETAAKESADKNAETKDAKNARDGGKKEKHRFRKASAEEEKIEKLEQEKALADLLPSAIMSRETEDAIKEAEHLKKTKYWEI